MKGGKSDPLPFHFITSPIFVINIKIKDKNKGSRNALKSIAKS